MNICPYCDNNIKTHETESLKYFGLQRIKDIGSDILCSECGYNYDPFEDESWIQNKVNENQYERMIENG